MPPELHGTPRRALAGRRRARPAADRRRGARPERGSSGRSSGWSARWSSCRCRWRRSGRRSASRAWTCSTALNVRDKSRMKAVLRAAGIPCARHQLVDRARTRRSRSPRAVGFPLVAKPPAGAGAQATYRLDDADALRSWLAAVPPRPEAPGLLEEFLVGEEHTFDSVQVGGDHGLGVGVGLPAPAAGRAAQPVDPVDGAAAARASTTRAYAAIRRDRTGRRRGARGARRVDAHGVVPAPGRHRWRCPRSAPGRRAPSSRRCWATCTTSTSTELWCELVLLGRFDPPERRYAAGCVYLRGQGRGQVRAVHGVDELQRRPRAPRRRGPAARSPGSRRRRTTTGEGYVIVRHPETAVVRDAVAQIVGGIRVELVEAP